MFGRRTRTQLPTAETAGHNYNDRADTQNERKTSLLLWQELQQELPPLLKGQRVRFVPLPGDRNRKWLKAKVEESADIRSYNVRTEDRRILRRKRRHLRRSREPFYCPQTSEAPTDVPSQHHSASPQKSQAPQWTKDQSLLVMPAQEDQPRQSSTYPVVTPNKTQSPSVTPNEPQPGKTVSQRWQKLVNRLYRHILDGFRNVWQSLVNNSNSYKNRQKIINWPDPAWNKYLQHSQDEISATTLRIIL